MITKTIKFKGIDISVKELTVAQLEEVLQDATTGSMTMIDRVFNPDFISERMIVLSTGLDAAELCTVAPSELRPIVDAVKEVNPDFLAGAASLRG